LPHRVITFGELMLRLSPPGFRRFSQASSFEASFGGGEANVAVSLACLGHDTAFVSRVPAHEIGDLAVQALRAQGVDTRFVARGGERLGVYFLEQGASQRGSKVVYDRAHSSISTLEPGEIDWDAVFEGASWFHWTGITPALGGHLPELVEAACACARRRGLTISADLNFRRKLWTPEAARACMIPLMEHVDICIANEEDAEQCLGLKAGRSSVENGSLDLAEYGELAKSLKARFGFKAVAITLRESLSASRNGWSALLLDDRDCPEPVRSRVYDVWLVDRVGAGDAFAAGLIHGLLTLGNTRHALEFAVATSCLKQTIPGDLNLATEAEVLALMRGSGSGRVQR